MELRAQSTSLKAQEMAQRVDGLGALIKKLGHKLGRADSLLHRPRLSSARLNACDVSGTQPRLSETNFIRRSYILTWTRVGGSP